MSLRRKITIASVLIILSVVAYFGFSMVYTVRHIPEAYAAWDTATLLVEYMKSHGNRWPSSWEDLLTVMQRKSGDPILMRGSGYGDTNYAAALRSKVSINWKFNPRHAEQSTAVTRLDGSKFTIVWQGAEPNEMVRTYLKSTSTNAPSIP